MEFELIIPKGWDCLTLKELTSKIGSGATPNGGNNSYKAQGIALVRSMNVYDSGFKNDGLAFIDDVQASKLSNVVLQSKDVLLNITGASIARCCIVPELALPGRVNQHVAILRAIEKKILPEFLHLFLISPKQKNRLLNISGGGATREALTKKMIEEIQIPLPPLPEQTRIVAKLDALFERIDKAIALLEGNIKRTGELMGAVLGNAFVELQTKYTSKPLLKYVDFIGGSQPPKSKFSNQPKEGYVRLIQIRDYKSDNFQVYVSQKSTKKFCEVDDVMIGRYGPPVFQILRGLKGAYNVALMKAEPDEKVISKDFLFWFLKTPEIQNYIIGISQRSAGQSGVNKKALEAYEITVPPMDVQIKIASMLETSELKIQELLEKYKAKLHHLQALKSSLLDQAFRGEL